MEFIFVLAMCWGIGMFAKSKGRSAWGWGIASLFISPLIAGIVLALMKDLSQEEDINKIEMQQQQLKERIAINEVQVNQCFQQVENRLNSTVAATMAIEERNNDTVMLSEGNVYCPYCGEIIKNSASKCRFCGMDVMPVAMKECPFCKEMIRKNATVCKYCHSKLEVTNADNIQSSEDVLVTTKENVLEESFSNGGSLGKTDSKAQGVVRKQEELTCHNCYTVLHPDSRFCPKCGSKIKDME